MPSRICFAYPWATFGGCERVFLNRALSFMRSDPKVELSFYFMQDSGGLNAFRSAIIHYGLTNCRIVENLTNDYDIVSLVDFPQAFAACDTIGLRYIVECHTGYPENRRYLGSLPSNCLGLVAPSPYFAELLNREFPNLKMQTQVLQNFVPWDVEGYNPTQSISLPKWTRRPILFLGRLDRLKDPVVILDALLKIEAVRPGEFMALFCGSDSAEVDLGFEIASRSLEGQVVRLPPIAFASVSTLLNAVVDSRGIFVSSSHAESFGLSAAEAICAQIPTVLSDIPSHRDLLQDMAEPTLFTVGDSGELARVLTEVADNYSRHQQIMGSLRNRFSASSFATNWDRLTTTFGIK